MKKPVAVCMVSAALVLSGSTVLAHPSNSHRADEFNYLSKFSQFSQFQNTFNQGDNQKLLNNYFNNRWNRQEQMQNNDDQNDNNWDEDHQQNAEQQDEHDDEDYHNEHHNKGHFTTGDEIEITTGFTTEDEINVSPQPTTGDVVSINPTIKVTTQITVTFNGKTLSFDQQPIIKNGSTLVPLRAIFDTLGAEINWDGKSRTVRSHRGKQNVMLKVGSNTATVNGKIVKLGQNAEIVNKRTMIPLRFITESYGANVNWNGSTHTINITQN